MFKGRITAEKLPEAKKAFIDPYINATGVGHGSQQLEGTGSQGSAFALTTTVIRIQEPARSFKATGAGASLE